MQVLVSEVGPRDGLQSIKRAMPTEAKHRWIRALAAAGLKEIEVASFVPAKLLPQMADAAEVVREAVKVPGITVLALAPNLKGAENAVAAGAHKVTLPVSASHAHSLANIRMSCEEAIEEVGKICAFRDGIPAASRPKVEVGLSTAFGCTLQGDVDEDWVFEMANRVAAKGADTVGLSDTVGYANPVQVKRMFTRLMRELGDKAGGAHLHNTRGQGLANVVAALDAGVTTFDSSQGGIGHLRKELGRHERRDFDFPEARGGERPDPAMFRLRGHRPLDALEPVARADFAHQDLHSGLVPCFYLIEFISLR